MPDDRDQKIKDLLSSLGHGVASVVNPAANASPFDNNSMEVAARDSAALLTNPAALDTPPAPNPLADAIKAHPGAATPQDLNQSIFERGWGKAAEQQPVVLPAAPAPAPAPAPAGKGVSVGAPAPTPEVAPFQSLVPSMPAGGPAPAPTAPAAPAAKAPEPPDEMAAAQDGVNKKKWLAALLSGLSGFSSHGEELSKGIMGRLNSPVTNLLARKEFARKQLEDKEKASEFERKKLLDSNVGPLAEQAQMLARIYHPDWKPEDFKRVTPNMLAGLKDATSVEQLAKNENAMRAETSRHNVAAEKGEAGKTAAENYKTNKQFEAEMAKLGAKNGGSSEVAPGYTEGNVKIADKEKENFRSAVAERAAIEKNLATMDALHKKHGSEALPGDVKDQYQSLETDTLLHMNKLSDLARFTPLEKGEFDKMIPHATGLGNVGAELVGRHPYQVKANQLRQYMANKEAGLAQAYGLKGGPAATEDKVSVMPPGGTIPKLIPRSQVQAALAAGGKLVGG